MATAAVIVGAAIVNAVAFTAGNALYSTQLNSNTLFYSALKSRGTSLIHRTPSKLKVITEKTKNKNDSQRKNKSTGDVPVGSRIKEGCSW
jgi:hypothetical protein